VGRFPSRRPFEEVKAGSLKLAAEDPNSASLGRRAARGDINNVALDPSLREERDIVAPCQPKSRARRAGTFERDIVNADGATGRPRSSLAPGGRGPHLPLGSAGADGDGCASGARQARQVVQRPSGHINSLAASMSHFF
jgi:hypothetical protein